jgi:hypothetical protein
LAVEQSKIPDYAFRLSPYDVAEHRHRLDAFQHQAKLAVRMDEIRERTEAVAAMSAMGVSGRSAERRGERPIVVVSGR